MDVIGDFLTRIRNAGKAEHEKVDLPSSKVKVGIAEVLKQYGYIKDFRVVKVGVRSMMRVYLRYLDDGSHAIEQLRRVSTPGLRRYIHADKIPQVRSGYGISILSTNKGIVGNKEATEKKLGGEILCQVW